MAYIFNSLTLEANTETEVYKVPAGKNAMVYVEVWQEVAGDIEVKVDGKMYYKKGLAYSFAFKIVLKENVSIRILTTNSSNVFVYGMEV